jgi:hypothetical protein
MNYKYFFLLMILMATCLSPSAIADTFTVTNTNDAGPGSLRQAMIDANDHAGADTIIFNIPTSDSNYNTSIGVWKIQPASELPLMNRDGTVIDGTSQTVNQGDTNPNGPEIEIDGTNVNGNGFYIEGAANKISGFIINRFNGAGIFIGYYKARSNIVTGNFIGTNATGTSTLPNYTGIAVHYRAKLNIIGGTTEEDRNVISGNEYGIDIYSNGTDSNAVLGNYIGIDASGEIALGNTMGCVFIVGDCRDNMIGGATPQERNIISGSTHSGNIYMGNGVTINGGRYNKVIGNFIGTNKDGTKPLPNIDYGVSLTYGQANIIGGTAPGEGNVISGNDWGGIFIRFSETMNNVITGNFIGTDVTGLINLGNFHEGIYLDYGAKNNIIGPNNVIVNNGVYGIIVKHDSTTNNKITQNSISNHSQLGIRNEEGGNSLLTPPTITEVSDTQISGTAPSNSIVEIFSDSEDEGAIYEGTVTTDASGNFSWSGTATGPHITATAIDAEGNTSIFSLPYITKIDEYRHWEIPANYSLKQNYPNPFNSNTQIQYGLAKSGHVSLKILNLLGEEVVVLVNQYQSAGYHAITWNGKDANDRSVQSGIYYYKIEVAGYSASKKLVLVK